jgi:hypothetical protein
MQPKVTPAGLAQQDHHLLIGGGNFIMSNEGSGGGMLSPLTLIWNLSRMPWQRRGPHRPAERVNQIPDQPYTLGNNLLSCTPSVSNCSATHLGKAFNIPAAGDGCKQQAQHNANHWPGELGSAAATCPCSRASAGGFQPVDMLRV